MKNVYLICPVRNCTQEVTDELDEYVKMLEESGKYKCHYPPRDVDQDQTGINTCEQHRDAMQKCDEVHIWWDEDSKGSHFDFGMAFALDRPIVIIKDIEQTPHKSYGNVLNYLSSL